MAKMKKENFLLSVAVAFVVISVIELKFGLIGDLLTQKSSERYFSTNQRNNFDKAITKVTKRVESLPEKQVKQELSQKYSFPNSEALEDIRTADGLSTCHPRNKDSLKFDVKERIQHLSDTKARYDDPELIKIIRESFIDYPQTSVIKDNTPAFKTLQADAADNVLNQKENGFFVECGAYDGKWGSNTLFLENERQWTGVLIEMDPEPYGQLCDKNRNAYSLNVCLSTKTHPITVPFVPLKVRGILRDGEEQRLDENEHSKYPTGICFPLQSIMVALNRSKIDYFSLDVEGKELSVLETISFDELDISVLSVEFAHVPNKTELVDYMTSRGYTLHDTLVGWNKAYFYCKDYIFVKEGKS